jgi:hypothetical protein
MVLNVCKEERENVSRKWANKIAYRGLVGNRNEGDGVEDQGIQKKMILK